MLDDTPTGSCRDTCTAPCAGPPASIPIAEALDRFERGATRGEYRFGRWFAWGDGAPLVFVHGEAETSLAFVGLAAQLSPWFRCIAYNQRQEMSGISPADLASDLWDVLDAVGAERAYVHAVSFGTAIALSAMRDRPSRLPRAILQDVPSRAPRSMLRRLVDRVRPPASRLREEFSDRPPELLHRWLDVVGTTPRRTVLERLNLLDSLDLRSVMGEVRQPVLVVKGEREPDSDDAASVLPNAGRVVIEGGGRLTHWTHVEALTQAIRMFLTPPTPCEHHDSRVPLNTCRGPV